MRLETSIGPFSRGTPAVVQATRGGGVSSQHTDRRRGTCTTGTTILEHEKSSQALLTVPGREHDIAADKHSSQDLKQPTSIIATRSNVEQFQPSGCLTRADLYQQREGGREGGGGGS